MCAVWRMCFRSYSRGSDRQQHMLRQKGMLSKLYIMLIYTHACKESTQKYTLQRQGWLVYNDPCFVFFRGETARALTSPKTCTSKREPLFNLHKCSTMDPDTQCNVHLLMISALYQLPWSSTAWAKLKLFCWGKKHIHVCLTGCAVILCPFFHICCIRFDLLSMSVIVLVIMF